MDAGGTSLKTGIYCRGCGYDLRESELRCPECGRAFDRAKPGTFYASPRSVQVRWWIKCILLMLLMLLPFLLPPAIGLGWLAWEWREEQKHMAVLEQGGGKLSLREVPTWLSKSLPARWRHLAYRASSLVMLGGQLPERDFAHVASLSHLERITLHFTQITDEHLRHVRGLTKLQVFRVGGPQITDEGLACLAGLRRMQWLGLTDTSITDLGLNHLAAMVYMEHLELNGSPVGDEGAAHLSGLRNLRTLDLSRTRITDAGLKHVAGLRSLTWLVLQDTAVTDAGLEELTALPDLESLDLRHTRTTPAGEQRLRAVLPRIRIESAHPVPSTRRSQ